MITNKLLITLLVISSLFITFSVDAQNNIIRDSDVDTKIETERNADEDIIRIQVGGVDHFRIGGPTLEFLNTGNSVFIGQNAGINDDLSNNSNTFIGSKAGEFTTTGNSNVALGQNALRQNTTGIRNLAMGQSAMSENLTGGFNVAIGSGSLREATTATNNTVIGAQAGLFTTGSGNIFLGFKAGFNETGSDKLIIENSDSASPLIGGDFSTDQVSIAGATLAAGYALNVNGKMIGTEVRVLEVANWPDYVFTPNYDLKPLEDVKSFIDENGHLPNIPSAKVVAAEGFELGVMQKNLLEKVEELTLYMIQTNEDVKELKKENEQLKKELELLKNK